MRLCANTGCHLHLVEPLGFDLEEKKLRRAGLDYRDFSQVSLHPNVSALEAALGDTRMYAITTRGQRPYHSVHFQAGDTLLFGPETRGLPEQVLEEMGPDHCIRIPMLEGSRSLNLSNAAALVSYEALRQLEFEGLA